MEDSKITLINNIKHNWHPIYKQLNFDIDLPCYNEFKSFTNCLNQTNDKNSNIKCYLQYNLLIKCLKKIGFDNTQL